MTLVGIVSVGGDDAADVGDEALRARVADVVLDHLVHGAFHVAALLAQLRPPRPSRRPTAAGRRRRSPGAAPRGRTARSARAPSRRRAGRIWRATPLVIGPRCSCPRSYGRGGTPYRVLVPTEPPPTTWVLPDPSLVDHRRPRRPRRPRRHRGRPRARAPCCRRTARGLFPMPGQDAAATRRTGSARSERGVLPLDWPARSRRSLRRSARDFEIRVNTAFDEVVAACADPSPARRAGSTATSARRLRPRCTSSAGRTPSRRGATAGWSGGLYGVALGGLFAGESMFHRERDASKVALLGLVEAAPRRARRPPPDRRAVADPPPGLAGRDGPVAGVVPAPSHARGATAGAGLFGG